MLCILNILNYWHAKPEKMLKSHNVKSIQILSCFWSLFSCIGLNTGKYGPEKTPYLNTFHPVSDKSATVNTINQSQSTY